MVLSLALVILVGAKPGAGPHHLMPLIPVLLFLTLTLRRYNVEAADPSAILAIAMIAAAIGPLAATINFLNSSAMRAGETNAGYREAVDLPLVIRVHSLVRPTKPDTALSTIAWAPRYTAHVNL